MRTIEMGISVASDKEDESHFLTGMNRSDDRYCL